MDDRFDRLESKLDRIGEHLGSIDVTLARNTATLEEHVKRTAQLEDRVTPLEAHSLMQRGAWRLVGLIGLLLGIAEAIRVLMGK